MSRPARLFRSRLPGCRRRMVGAMGTTVATSRSCITAVSVCAGGFERHENVLIDTSQLPGRQAVLGVDARLGDAFGPDTSTGPTHPAEYSRALTVLRSPRRPGSGGMRGHTQQWQVAAWGSKQLAEVRRRRARALGYTPSMPILDRYLRGDPKARPAPSGGRRGQDHRVTAGRGRRRRRRQRRRQRSCRLRDRRQAGASGPRPRPAGPGSRSAGRGRAIGNVRRMERPAQQAAPLPARPQPMPRAHAAAAATGRASRLRRARHRRRQRPRFRWSAQVSRAWWRPRRL